jgi:hypothetical protein
MFAETKAGIITAQDGYNAPARFSRIQNITTGEGQGKYYENASRGNIFSLILPVTNAVAQAGNIYPLSTANPSTQFSLWNPLNSGKNLSLLKFGVAPISGTAPAGPMMHVVTNVSLATQPTIISSIQGTPVQTVTLGGGPESASPGTIVIDNITTSIANGTTLQVAANQVVSTITGATGTTSGQVWTASDGGGASATITLVGSKPVGLAALAVTGTTTGITIPGNATIVNMGGNVIQCNNTGLPANSVARAIVNTAGVAATGLNTNTATLGMLRLADFWMTAGSEANLVGMKVIEYIDGDIVIGPGSYWTPCWSAAGTAWYVGYSITWEEIPV